MIEFDKIFKVYSRFLKEEGIYHKVLTIHGKGNKFSAKNVLQKDHMFTHWIQHDSTFCLWSNTNEGRDFWMEIHLLWLIKCLEFCGGEVIYDNFKVNKEYVNSSISVFLRSFNDCFYKNDEKKIIEKSEILKKYINYE